MISIIALLVLSIYRSLLDFRELVVATGEISGAIEKGRAHAEERSVPQSIGAPKFICYAFCDALFSAPRFSVVLHSFGLLWFQDYRT